MLKIKIDIEDDFVVAFFEGLYDRTKFHVFQYDFQFLLDGWYICFAKHQPSNNYDIVIVKPESYVPLRLKGSVSRKINYTITEEAWEVMAERSSYITGKVDVVYLGSFTEIGWVEDKLMELS